MVGFVLSMLTVAGSVAVLPALSSAVPVTGWFWPSVVLVWGAVQLAMPESESVAAQWIEIDWPNTYVFWLPV